MKAKIVLALMALAVLLLFVTAVWAQSVPVGSNNLSGTITTTNTFQVVQGQANNRIGCTIQNPGTNTNHQWVFFDKTNSSNCSAAAKSPGSVDLQPGQSVYCSVALGFVLKDQVCITGTSGDAFFANFQ